MANDFIVTVDDFVVPASSDPNRCRIYGFVVDSTGLALANFLIQVLNRSLPYVVVDSGVARGVAGASVTFKSNEDGYVEFDLIRNGTYDIFYPSESPNPFKSNIEPYICIRVPDLPSMTLIDLLFPVPDTLEFLISSPVTLAVGNDVVVPIQVINTDKTIADHLTQVLLVSSDPAKVVLSIVSPSSINLHRTAVGQVFITATINTKKVPVTKQPAAELTLLVNTVEDPIGLDIS